MEGIREQHGLTGLRIGYRELSSSEPMLTCALDAAGHHRESWEMPAAAVGLLAGREQPDQTAADDLRSCRGWLAGLPAIHALKAGGQALWLAITDEHPLLPAIDWESGLAELGAPVLRIPVQLGSPTAPPRRPRVVLWVSMPLAKEAFDARALVDGALYGMSTSGGEFPEVHLFADAGLVDEMRSAFGGDVVVHDPVVEGPHEPVRRGVSPMATGTSHQPWLEWIVRGLGGASADVLHLIGHGLLSAGQGAFACAEAPDRNYDRSSARFVWPQQLSALLTRTGSWAAVFTAAPHNFSAEALRLLAGRTAALRAAATAFHDADQVGPVHGPDTVYRLLLAHPQPPPITRGLALTMHPGRFGVEAVSADYRPGRSELGALVDSGVDLPGWMVGAQRQIAQWETQLSFGSGAERVDDTRSGLELAKKRLDDLVRGALDEESGR